MRTARLQFSRWRECDLPLAALLWGERDVTRYISKSGAFTPAEIEARLAFEIENMHAHGVQYWPVFLLENGEFVGACGLRPYKAGVFELGFHLRSAHWGAGLATEAARAVIGYARQMPGTSALFAGHNPQNAASRAVLLKLGFEQTGEQFYGPTGLMHPSYELQLK